MLLRLIALLICFLAMVMPAAADDAAVRRELVPRGTLRVAIAVGPAPSGIYVVKDGDSYRGVTIDLSRRLAEKLNVPVTFVPYLASGEIQGSAQADAWDVTFMPVDAERRKFVDFGSPYHMLESTYLAAPGAAIRDVADVNKAGVRIAGVRDTATLRASMRNAPLATHVVLGGVDACIDAMREGRVDAIALGRASLGGLVPKVPGARIADGNILRSTTAIAVPKGRSGGRSAALSYVSAFIEEAKAEGLVRRAFDAVGLTAEVVAPVGLAP